MTQWTGAAQAYLDAGNRLTLLQAIYAEPRRLDTGAVEPVAYWSGVDPLELVINGTQRIYQPVWGALKVEPIQGDIKTTFKGDRVSIFGLSPEGASLYRSLNVEQAYADMHMIAMNAGGVVIGTKQKSKGLIEAADMTITAKSAELTLEIFSRMAAGTRVIQAKKSNASYLARGGDEAMQYASLKDVESDTWK